MKKILFLMAGVLVLCMSGQVAAQYGYTDAGAGHQDAELMFKAASTGDLITINRLANRDRSLVNYRSTRDGRTPLHVAAQVGMLTSVQMLLSRGADPNVKDYYCKTPYAYARMGYWHKVARLLKKRGAKREYVRFFPHCCTEDHPNPARRKGRTGKCALAR